MLRERFPDACINYPAIFVAANVIALSATLEHMQSIATTCCKWAKENGLRWNPDKSHFLSILLNIHGEQQRERQADNLENLRQEAPQQQAVLLDDVPVVWSGEADYLGLRINTGRGFIFKEWKNLLARGKMLSVMMVKEKWFSLRLHPKFKANIYDT